MENLSLEKNTQIEPQEILSSDRFILFSFFSFGLYNLWWMYKAWRFYNQKENTDIMPAARAIFCLFFLDSLLSKILSSAKSKGYSEQYTPTLLFLGFIFTNFLSYLPDPFWLISSISFLFLIPPFKALNYYKENSPEITIIEQKPLTVVQISLIILGALFWSLVLLGFFIE